MIHEGTRNNTKQPPTLDISFPLASTTMKILILGGTVFLGRHLVESALTKGHEVTLFNRGRQHPELFPQVEKLRGSREGDLEALRGRRWDAAIDPSGYL